jgi:hypothetical protein
VRAVIVEAYERERHGMCHMRRRIHVDDDRDRERERRTAPVLYVYRLYVYFLFFSDIMMPIPVCIWTDISVYLFGHALFCLIFFLAGGGCVAMGGTRRGGASTAFAQAALV